MSVEREEERWEREGRTEGGVMSAYDELVGRLGRQHEIDVPGVTGFARPVEVYVNPDGPEAAAAIRELVGERDRAKELCDHAEVMALGEATARQAAEAKLEAVTKLLERAVAWVSKDNLTAIEARAFLASLDTEKAGG